MPPSPCPGSSHPPRAITKRDPSTSSPLKGTCSECGLSLTLVQGGVLRKHKAQSSRKMPKPREGGDTKHVQRLRQALLAETEGGPPVTSFAKTLEERALSERAERGWSKTRERVGRGGIEDAFDPDPLVSSLSSLPDPVTDYARQVISGQILTSKWVRQACQRHLADLSRTDIYWDLEAANRHLDFFPDVLVLAFREEPHERPFHLLPWQRFVQGSLFGWKRVNPDGTIGYRRFQYAYIEGAKGCGKSPEGAGTALYMTTSDGEPQAETYFAAADKDQAMVAFRHAVSMSDLSPDLSKRLLKSGLKPVWQLTYGRAVDDSERKYLGSFIRPIASDNTQSGPRPHFVLIDELHEVDRPTVVDMMRKAMGKNRTQPMIYEITNSGVDRHSICYQHRQQAERMLDGTAPNDSLFAFICGLDVGDENLDCICDKSSSWDRRHTCPHCGDLPKELDGRAVDPMEYLLAHEEIWVKANPGIGIVPSYEYVRQQIHDAIGLPSQRNLVLRLHFCVWTDSISVWIPDETWMRGADLSLSLHETVHHPIFGRMARLESELIGKRCYGGIDLARTDDLSALFLVFPDDESGLDINDQTYSILEWYFCDDDTLRERVARDKVPYDLWRDSGHLLTYPGSTFNPAYIRRHILDVVCPRYQLEGVAYDRTFAHQVILDLQEDGLVMVDWAQTHWWMGAPVAEIARRAKAGLWRHRGHPATRWMMANVAIETDAGGLQKISKNKSRERVDGPVALANATGWCMRANKGEGLSAIERRGAIVIEDAYL